MPHGALRTSTFASRGRYDDDVPYPRSDFLVVPETLAKWQAESLLGLQAVTELLGTTVAERMASVCEKFSVTFAAHLHEVESDMRCSLPESRVVAIHAKALAATVEALMTTGEQLVACAHILETCSPDHPDVAQAIGLIVNLQATTFSLVHADVPTCVWRVVPNELLDSFRIRVQVTKAERAPKRRRVHGKSKRPWKNLLW